MIRETDHDYHVRRARAEFDLAYRSDCRAATESHLRLSSLHMQRLRDLPPSPPPARFERVAPGPALGFARRPAEQAAARDAAGAVSA